MKVLVTGGAGFIGSHLVDLLLQNEHEVFIVDDLSSGCEQNMKHFENKIRFIKDSINGSEISSLIEKEKFETIFHLAAQKNVRKSVEDPIFDAEINVLGSINLLEAARKSDVKKFVFASTGGAIYGEPQSGPQGEDEKEMPMSPYGITKLATEKYLHYYKLQYGLDYASMRYANVYGPRQDPYGEAGVVAIFCKNIAEKKPCFINGDGKQSRDFVFVKDVAEVSYQAAMYEGSVGEINVGTARETSINELFELICDAAGEKINAEHREAAPGEQRRSVLSYDKAREILGFKPKFELEDGIKITYESFKKD